MAPPPWPGRAAPPVRRAALSPAAATSRTLPAKRPRPTTPSPCEGRAPRALPARRLQPRDAHPVRRLCPRDALPAPMAVPPRGGRPCAHPFLRLAAARQYLPAAVVRQSRAPAWLKFQRPRHCLRRSGHAPLLLLPLLASPASGSFSLLCSMLSHRSSCCYGPMALHGMDGLAIKFWCPLRFRILRAGGTVGININEMVIQLMH